MTIKRKAFIKRKGKIKRGKVSKQCPAWLNRVKDDRKGFDLKSLSKYKNVDVRLLLRNCVEPELGKHILDWAQKEYHHTAPFFTTNT